MSGERTAIPTCREVVDRLAEWSEGQLPEEAAAPLATHLQLCPPCAHIASEYRALGRLAREAMQVDMPDDAKERLRKALAARLRGGGN
jgi:anti-sigma factor ChrR (cupin superfamily)